MKLQLRQGWQSFVLSYVVYSYATPIAWKDCFGCWYLNKEKYSVTTSRHQGIVQTVISQIQ